MSSRNIVYKIQNFDFTNASPAAPKKGKKYVMIEVMNPDINSVTKLVYVLDIVSLVTGGIPILDSDNKFGGNGYYPDDASREFIRLALDEDQPRLRAYLKFLQNGEEWAESDEVQEALFPGVEKKNITFMPMVTEHEQEDKEEKSDRKSYKMIKIRFNVWPENEKRVIRTCFVPLDDDAFIMDKKTKDWIWNKDYKGPKTPQQYETITELNEDLFRGSKFRAFIEMNRFWIMEKKAGKVTKYEYGIAQHFEKIEFTRGVKTSDGNGYSFDDGERSEDENNTNQNEYEFDESEEEEVKPAKSPKKNTKPAPKSKKPVKEPSVEEESEEEEEAPKPKKKAKKAKKVPEPSEEEEEEIAPKPKKGKGKGKK